MTLLFGTDEGVYRADGVADLDDATQVVDAGRVMRVRTFGDGVAYAASKTGLYRSEDGGERWENLEVPRTEVYSVLESPDGERLYAGTHPAHLFVSEGDGEVWRELEGFQELPSREEWFTPRHRNEAHIRSLVAHPDAPERVIAGVEVGSVHVSEDRGETWHERREGVQDDVHHVLGLRPDSCIASCGNGLYLTEDVGATWTRLDRDLKHRYFREAFRHDGRLYAAAARSSPGKWSGVNGADAALFVSDDGGDSFDTREYDGGPEEVILAWAAVGDEVIAGTNDGGVVREGPDRWTSIGRLPAGIRSMCTIQ